MLIFSLCVVARGKGKPNLSFIRDGFAKEGLNLLSGMSYGGLVGASEILE